MRCGSPVRVGRIAGTADTGVLHADWIGAGMGEGVVCPGMMGG